MITASGANPLVVERVRYDAYGKGEHRWPGDFDDSGQVNSTDEDMLDNILNGGGASLGDPEYDVAMDLNRDGVIDSADMAIFQSWFAHWQTSVGVGRLSDPTAADNVVGFAGYTYSREVRLYCQRFRWYDPETGRWLERDPAGAVDGVNLYQYVRSSPLVGVDPFGLDFFDPNQPGIRYNPSSGGFIYDSFTDRIRNLIDGANDAFGCLSEADRKSFRRFNDTQDCILKRIGRCGTTDEHYEWMASVLEGFMTPYITSMEERCAGGNVADAGWREFFRSYDAGELNTRYVRGGVRLLPIVAASTWIQYLFWHPSHEDVLILHGHRVAHAMAINHIKNDLSRALQTSGIGDDCVWGCIGNVVEECSKEMMNSVERSGAAAGGALFPGDLKIQRMRDDMRDDVKRRPN